METQIAETPQIAQIAQTPPSLTVFHFTHCFAPTVTYHVTHVTGFIRFYNTMYIYSSQIRRDVSHPVVHGPWLSAKLLKVEPTKGMMDFQT